MLGRAVPVVPADGAPGFDVPASFVPVLLPVARRVGLCRPDPEGHALHFDVCPAG